ncbi:MAG: hypothetical protein PF482_08920 [Desulfobacteraceae bacterium]|nr:hypothetical protein [Desulfobacteraceae bacterium]
MQLKEKYNLSDMLNEIEDDLLEQKKDVSQEKNIPQEIITEMMLSNLKAKKKKNN